MIYYYYYYYYLIFDILGLWFMIYPRAYPSSILYATHPEFEG